MIKLLMAVAMLIPSAKALDKIEVAYQWHKTAWDNELKYQITTLLPDLETARDIELWCPNYFTMDTVGRTDVWATIFVSIAYYESTYKPTSRHIEGSGVWSIGLFQLSTPDEMPWCRHTTEDDLTDPENNIKCAVPLFVRLVSADHVIADGTNGKNAIGAAKYWAVMRDGTYRGHHLQNIKDNVAKFCGVDYD